MSYANNLKASQTRKGAKYGHNLIAEGMNMVLPYSGHKRTPKIRPAVVVRVLRINRLARIANR